MAQEGIEWVKEPGKARASTSSINIQIWISFLSALIISHSDSQQPLPRYVEDAQDLVQELQSMAVNEWRHGYIQILNSITIIQASATNDEAIVMARAGLEALQQRCMTCRGRSARDAVFLSSPASASSANSSSLSDEQHNFTTLTIKGRTKGTDSNCGVEKYALLVTDVEGKGEVELTGQAMRNQMDAWVQYGCMEPSAAQSACAVSNIEDMSSWIDGKVFVLLGATSELGPAKVLAQMGGTIVAIARCGTKLQSLIRSVRDETCGTILVPIRSQSEDAEGTKALGDDNDAQDDSIRQAGADLMTDTPELARWITSLYPGKELVIASLAYLDGEKNVRATVGMDLICDYVCSHRRNTSLSYLVSPATAHVITEEAAVDAQKRFENSSFVARFLSKPRLGFHRYAVTDALPNNNLRVFNGLADLQGPNYALSKAAQQWRAMVARQDGHTVSANMTPAARTQNMISHSSIAFALEGMQSFFPPFVAFHPVTARTLMTALLLWDLNEEKSTANPNVLLRHVMCLFEENSVHGGSWRCPYDLTKMGLVSYACGRLVRKPGSVPLDCHVENSQQEENN